MAGSIVAAALLAVCSLLALEGCGGGGDDAVTTTTSTTPTTTTSTTPTTTTSTTRTQQPTPQTTPTPSELLPTYDSTWKSLFTGDSCIAVTPLSPKRGGPGGNITCTKFGGIRHFKFPAGVFDIDEQVHINANTEVEGNANPNDPADRSKQGESSMQTYFMATQGVTDKNVPYCGTNNNLQQSDTAKLRIGFLLHSNTVVRNINFQGKDTVRPLDNGNLCGGGAFETPGCVSPGFGDGPGAGWIDKRVGCYDHTGKKNDLVTGDGKGVENVTIDNVRLNSLLLPNNPGDFRGGQGSQLAVWVAMTADGSATKNVKVTNLVSMLTRADGINLHGNVQDSLIQDCHIENTGDDIYAFWGAYAESPVNNVFNRNVGKNAGVTRDYMYGVCVAVYGAKSVTFQGNKCYDPKDWNREQVPDGDNACKNGAYCNSCFAYVHGKWFGAVYPSNNAITFDGNEYFYMEEPTSAIPEAERPLVRHDVKNAEEWHAHIVIKQATITVA
eukprot:TRINITY_DN2250_c0_g1_i1.p1 TRINITY_DN2250_c0_g1~~TRINITY_DN2250_c0_g1_i1.p1  ORF type:complete len:528 (-),score=67.11 TRINITY_DN2250_c0_g1_i1:38-1531(-)